MIHRPSLTAFARDVTHALGILTVAAAVADYRAEVKCLRAENAYLKAQQARHVEYIDQLAAADAIADYFIKERVEENARVWLHDNGISEEWLDMEVAE